MAMEAGMRSNRGDLSTKTKDPSKAIFAIREVFQKDIVYQTRGMACAVRCVGGSARLVTWYGVIGESDCNKSVNIVDRFSKKFSSHIKKYRHEKPTILKENDRFSFLSVDCGKEANVTVLDLKVPANDIKTSDLTAFSFSGEQDLQLKFKYEESKEKHELTVDGKKPKSFILEKSNVLGSPIMVDHDGRKLVVGVVGEIGGELRPVFITEAELDLSKEEIQAKDKSELVTDLSKEGKAKDKSELVINMTDQGRNLKEGLKDSPSSPGTDELDAIGVKTGDLINDETKQNAMGVGLTSQLHTRDNLMRNLSSRNLVVDEVKGDGNCFFRTVARQLCKHMTRYKETVGEHCTSLGLGRCEEEDTRQLRQLFVTELRGNIDEYKKRMTSGSDMLKEIGKFEVNGYFESDVGDFCVTATAKLLRIPIVLVTARQTPPTMEFVPQDLATTTPPIVLAYNHSGPGHYDATNEIQSSDKNIEKVIPAETRYTHEPIKIEVKPMHQEQKEGSRVEFMCNVLGKSEVSYKWLKDGTEIKGQNNCNLVLDCVKMCDFGCYECQVSDTNGPCRLSAKSELDVIPRDGMFYKLLNALDPTTQHRVELLLNAKIRGQRAFTLVAYKYKMDKLYIKSYEENPDAGRMIIEYLGSSHPDLTVYEFCKTLKQPNIRRLDIINELLGQLSVPFSEGTT